MKLFINSLKRKSAPISIFLLLLVTASVADDTNAPSAAASPPSTNSSGTTSSDGSKTLQPVGDVGIASDGTTKDADGYQVRIGELYSPGGESYIIPILLPILPDGQQFKAAHFRVQVLAIDTDTDASPLGNADLYSLGLRDNSKFLATDYYEGASPDSRATLIQANFLTPQSPVRTDSEKGPFVETTNEADIAFAKYLNDLYAKGGAAGKYLILRISYDVSPIPSGNNAYQLMTSGAKVDQERPTFIYTLR